MKRTLHTILITTILLTLLFTSCNADASAGLFRQIADSKAPVGITYRQIIGTNTDKDTLYFLTNDGIYKRTGATTTSVRANGKLKPVYNAYVDGTTLVYVVNSSVGAEVGQYNLTSGTDTTQSHPTNEGYNEYVIKGIYANKRFLLEGKDTTDTKQFSLAEYTPNTNTLVDKVTIDASAGLKLHSVLQMSGLQQEPITTHPMILSFVKADNKTYQHFYTEGTTAKTWELTLGTNRSLAAFAISGGNLYVITEDGHLYESVVPTTDTPLTHKKDLGRSYSANAFMYAVKDATTHLITKTTTESEGLFVITDTAGTITTKAISEGYASQMKNVNIVSAFKKPAGNLLIATEKNGMFDISITDAATGAGTSKGPEDYTI